MSDVLSRVRTAPATTMDTAEYGADFAKEFEAAAGIVWKLERAQHFDEGDLPSYLAMLDGDWDRAMELADEMRPGFRADNPDRMDFRRIRVVAEPLTPYLRWELPLLSMRAEEGENSRVVPVSAVRPYEADGPVPELVLFNSTALYEVRYDETGRHTGARKITDPEIVEPCVPVLEALFDAGEELRAYSARLTG
ncbi:hypothetical protein SAMN05421874_1308 [Nonomuraea maritima]|uniref:DUF6879 domain-containing protein n=1 Tax=Nonomuraea maritima TaxID=683260 RepID=A0A1G9N987_9ACTN|nr:DUF6879 family protein [Nonomuraea maritima]SDL82445.1 hypothetical protein SAMN05421874_1308 [Nonomuraea maritima]